MSNIGLLAKFWDFPVSGLLKLNDFPTTFL